MHVPGWHEAVRSLGIGDRLQMVGILQEQHPDRARLFMQWKRMDWPLLVDSLGLLGVPYVPITLAIDEGGIVRRIDPPLASPDELKSTFVERRFPGGEEGPSRPPSAPDLEELCAAAAERGAAGWRACADALFLWGGPRRLDEAISLYRKAIGAEPEDGATHFRLGVAYRARYDSEGRRPGDFRRAVEAWARALHIDPNNYIRRRRIQQYGPRLEKPYSFYDWVALARREIRARGEQPLPLIVEPGGAEFARPAAAFAPAAAAAEPDPEGRIVRDTRGFIRVESTVVPPAIAPGTAARVHVTFTPNAAIKAHWNNEVSDLLVWLSPPNGWQVESRRHAYPNPPQPVSREVREVEFEARAPEGAVARRATISGYALYYVCEDVKGTCLYRRQDLEIPVRVGAAERR
ncbi:MAG: hypothetical protein ACE5JH_00635 [Acidobacteriota bacterium]